VHCETTSADKNEIAVRISFAMNDGSLHNMTFRSSSHSRSIFADLVDYKAGGVVSSRCDSLPYLKTPEFALIRTHQISESIREGQIITCGAHLSHFGVVFGLNQGDIVYVRAASDGLYVETLLRSEWVLTSLLSGFLGSNRKAGILAVSGSFLLASASLPLPLPDFPWQVPTSKTIPSWSLSAQTESCGCGIASPALVFKRSLSCHSSTRRSLVIPHKGSSWKQSAWTQLPSICS
jgi:hypothetical protein